MNGLHADLDSFGDDLFESKQMAQMAWTDAGDHVGIIAEFLEKTYMDLEE